MARCCVCRAASRAAYALQLALGALRATVERTGAAAAPGVDLQAVLACAQRAASPLVRAGALALLEGLAPWLPHAQLECVLQVRPYTSVW